MRHSSDTRPARRGARTLLGASLFVAWAFLTLFLLASALSQAE